MTRNLQQKRISDSLLVQIIETGAESAFPAKHIVHLIRGGKRKYMQSKTWMQQADLKDFLTNSPVILNTFFDEQTKIVSQTGGC